MLVYKMAIRHHPRQWCAGRCIALVSLLFRKMMGRGGEGRGGGAYCRGSLVWYYGLGGGWALVRSRVGRLFEGIRYMCVTEGASCEAQDFRMQEGWWSPGDEAGMQGEILSAPGDLFRLRFWIPHYANDLTSWTLCNVYELLGNNTVN